VPQGSGYGAGSVPCPRCGSPYASPVGFSWWGGMLGPRMISLVKCNHCRLQYKGKTGESPNGFIAIYLGIGIAITLAIVIAAYAMLFM
jgi:hypothetical protein